MSENTFPVYTADAIANFYRTEVLTGQEAKHFSKNDLIPVPKVNLVDFFFVTFLSAACGNVDLQKLFCS